MVGYIAKKLRNKKILTNTPTGSLEIIESQHLVCQSQDLGRRWTVTPESMQ